ncbi:hypothetical protein BC835DRAFT_1421424 [Cytidiella melzeri]|nr:hypothetical protein BC835DRAFT_1421424 [Cytidiella melzeri]
MHFSISFVFSAAVVLGVFRTMTVSAIPYGTELSAYSKNPDKSEGPSVGALPPVHTTRGLGDDYTKLQLSMQLIPDESQFNKHSILHQARATTAEAWVIKDIPVLEEDLFRKLLAEDAFFAKAAKQMQRLALNPQFTYPAAPVKSDDQGTHQTWWAAMNYAEHQEDTISQLIHDCWSLPKPFDHPKCPDPMTSQAVWDKGARLMTLLKQNKEAFLKYGWREIDDIPVPSKGTGAQTTQTQ